MTGNITAQSHGTTIAPTRRISHAREFADLSIDVLSSIVIRTLPLRQKCIEKKGQLAPASLPCREYCQQSFLPHDVCSLSHPTGNNQAYTVKHIQKGLFIIADCTETENPGFERGCTGKDSPSFRWDLSSIELFIDAGDGALRQIALSPAGGVWDAKDSDVDWDSGAKCRTTFEEGRWTMTIELPYAAFGGKPHSGARWKLMAIRNAGRPSRFKSCGWPVVAHRDMGSAATLVFK